MLLCEKERKTILFLEIFLQSKNLKFIPGNIEAGNNIIFLKLTGVNVTNCSDS
jgi:hypothetical protein